MNTSPPVYVEFTNVPAYVQGPTLGPYDWLQVTYDTLRIPPDGEAIAVMQEGTWILCDPAAPYAGDEGPYTDFVISTR